VSEAHFHGDAFKNGRNLSKDHRRVPHTQINYEASEGPIKVNVNYATMIENVKDVVDLVIPFRNGNSRRLCS
jgi:hypothetical protein